MLTTARKSVNKRPNKFEFVFSARWLYFTIYPWWKQAQQLWSRHKPAKFDTLHNVGYTRKKPPPAITPLPDRSLLWQKPPGQKHTPSHLILQTTSLVQEIVRKQHKSQVYYDKRQKSSEGTQGELASGGSWTSRSDMNVNTEALDSQHCQC